MFHVKDHKTPYIFDPFAFLGPKRRQMLDRSWAKLFREEILLELPVKLLEEHYHPIHGRPTKELYAMLGVMVLQQQFNLTDEETVQRVAFDIQWHYALNIAGDSDDCTYISLKTLWTMRDIMTEHNLYTPVFEGVTDKISRILLVEKGLQRQDSMHIFSNMRHLGRIRLFAATIRKFLVNLKRKLPELFAAISKELTSRYLSKSVESTFAGVKPAESAKTLQSLGTDLFALITRFRDNAQVTGMSSYALLVRLLTDQCTVNDDPVTQTGKVSVKPNKEVPSDSLQNPSDPDAGYSGHKGQGYQVQVMETYNPNPDKKTLSLITHVAVESAHKSDAQALIPAIESTRERGLGPSEVLVDTTYGSDENCQKAKTDLQVTIVSPVGGKDSSKGLTLADFTMSESGEAAVCPQGHTPLFCKSGKDNHRAAFPLGACINCPRRTDCPVKAGHKAYYLRYNAKAIRLALRRAAERTPAWREKYRFRAGMEGSLSQYDRRTGVKHLRVRGLPAVSFCAVIKAAAINILRAVAFKNRPNEGVNHPETVNLMPNPVSWPIFQIIKERCLSYCNNLLERFYQLQLNSRFAAIYTF
ncbi:MAG: transposase [Nitrospirae bacterium]|nr:transposase [Nitrospirota bacterium]